MLQIIDDSLLKGRLLPYPFLSTGPGSVRQGVFSVFVECILLFRNEYGFVDDTCTTKIEVR